jgi:putative pyruvate formate lyase activating enzyme
MVFSKEISWKAFINIMDQCHPCYQAHDRPPLNRRITADEYAEAVNLAHRAGLSRLD